jgi:hypothetical protein
MFNSQTNSHKSLINLSNKLYSTHINQLGNSSTLKYALKSQLFTPGVSFLIGESVDTDCILNGKIDLEGNIFLNLGSYLGADLYTSIEGNQYNIKI